MTSQTAVYQAIYLPGLSVVHRWMLSIRCRGQGLGRGAWPVGLPPPVPRCARPRCRPAGCSPFGVRPLVSAESAALAVSATAIVGTAERWSAAVEPACPAARGVRRLRRAVRWSGVRPVRWLRPRPSRRFAGLVSGPGAASDPRCRRPLRGALARRGVRSSWDGSRPAASAQRRRGLPQGAVGRRRAATENARRHGGRCLGAASGAGRGRPGGCAARRGPRSSPGE